MNKLFSRFKRRLMVEAVGRAALNGALIGGSIELVFLIVMHLISVDPGWLWIAVSFAVPFIVSFALFFGIAYYPTQKRVARRIDECGLEERAGTMLQFKNQSSHIIDLQRRDATERIIKTQTQNLRFAFSRKAIVACGLILALGIGCAFVPYTIMNIFAEEEPVSDDTEEQMIKELLDQLRQKVDDAEIADGIKEDLDRVLDELEEDLEQAESDLEQAAQISNAESQIEDILGEYVTKDEIGEALEEFDSTAELGKAIERGDKEGVSEALDKMQSEIEGLDGEKQAEKLDGIAEDIKNALEMSGAPEDDSLREALESFSDALAEAADKSEAGEEIDPELDEAFDKAEEEINSALDEQEKIEEALKDLESTLEEAKDEMLGREPEESGEMPEGEMSRPEGEMPEGEMSRPEGEMPEGEMSRPEGEMPEGEMTGGEFPEGDMSGGGMGGTEGNGSSSMTEGIYDPSLGAVQYGEVFAAYYAEYLASLKEGEIPEDMQTILDKYYESLNK